MVALILLVTVPAGAFALRSSDVAPAEEAASGHDAHGTEEPEARVQAEPVQPIEGCKQTSFGYRCFHGPFQISEGPNQVYDAVPSIPEPGYITWARAALVDRQGRRVPHHAAHLHHAGWASASAHDMTCPNWPQRFFATGKERTKVVLPDGYGYFWDAKESTEYPYIGSDWGLGAHIDGMHEGQTTTMYLKLNIGYAPATADLIATEPVWLDIENCGDSEFDIPKGAGTRNVFATSWTFTMPRGGEFIALAGHLHDGGIAVKLRDLSMGSNLFISRALYERPKMPGYLTGMTTFSGAPGIPVAAGDELELTATYDSSRRRVGAMGIMVGLLAPTND